MPARAWLDVTGGPSRDTLLGASSSRTSDAALSGVVRLLLVPSYLLPGTGVVPLVKN